MHDTESQLQWSSHFAVVPPEQVASRDLRGDKILLPQSALEQLLASSSTPSVSHTHATFTSHDPFNPYASQSQASYRETAQLPNPLMFRLVNQANGNVVHAGIREFSADEGGVALSPYLLEALGISPSDFVSETESQTESQTDSETRDGKPQQRDPSPPRVIVHAKQLAKGTYVRLRPLEAGYNPDDWKSLLERQLRESFTTLSKDAVLSVRGVKGELFKFLVDKFLPEGDGICVVDTDLEVDIEALNEEQARETLRQIMAKSQPGSAHGSSNSSSRGGEIDIWKPVEGQVVPGEYVDYELPSWNRSTPLTIELSGVDPPESLDLLVSPWSTRQRSLPRISEHVFGNFSLARGGTKSVVIQPTNVELEGAEKLFISVHAYSPPNQSNDATAMPYSLRVHSGPVPPSDVPPSDNTHKIAAEAEGEHSPDEEQCKNCLKWVPKRTMVLHQNFCLRNNVVCPRCRSVFHKASPEWEAHWHCPLDDEFGDSPSSKAKHSDVRHTEKQCPSCDVKTPSLIELALHRTSVCPGKPILCQFCHLEVPQEGDPLHPSAEVLLSGLTAHEVADGARTTDCHLCGKIIRMRDMAAHLKHHDLDKASRRKPEICRNTNCGRTLHGVGARGAVGQGTRMGQGPGNELGLCSLCFGPFYVSMHDPEGKALRRRIERRYLSQLMTGCGRKWCGNEWCRTGRANRGLEAKPTGAQAVLPLVKPLVESVPRKERPMYFCVDEGSQRRRGLAEMLASENVWDFEWCIAGCEAASGDLDKAREWLQNWAPTKVSSTGL